MPIQGGGDLKFLRPVLPDEDDALGAHRGNFEALNIRNAQRGFRYVYQRKDPSAILQYLNRGYKVVTADDPEGWGAELPESVGLALDGVHAYHDVVLMKIPLDKYRQHKAERIERRKAALDAHYHAFKSKERERLNQLSQHTRPEGRELYYRKPDHFTEFKDEPQR